jgi:hypothetical protein
VLRGALCVLLFCAAFGAASSALRPFLAGQASNLTETKLSWFREHGAAYDTLFFGSSRAYRGFVPEVFERETATAGVETRAFNFGSPASRAFDAHRMLERLERGGGLDHVKWVLVDPEPLPWLLRAKDKESMLARGPIDWHDPLTTWLVLRYIWSYGDATLAEKLAASAEHLHSCCYFVAGIGGTENLVNAMLGKSLIDRTELTDRLGRRLDGWLPLDDSNVSRESHKSKFLSPRRQEAYRRDLAERRADAVDSGPASPRANVFFTRLAARIESFGATPVFVTQPSLSLQHDLVKAWREGQLEHLLRYDDPDDERAAPLFLPENRWDKFHLAESGATIFTELLARDFAELVRGLERRP